MTKDKQVDACIIYVHYSLDQFLEEGAIVHDDLFSIAAALVVFFESAAQYDESASNLPDVGVTLLKKLASGLLDRDLAEALVTILPSLRLRGRLEVASGRVRRSMDKLNATFAKLQWEE